MDSLAKMLTDVRDGLDRILLAVAATRETLGPSEQPMSLDDLAAGAIRARDQADRCLMAADDDELAALATTLADDVAAPRIRDDLAAMVADPAYATIHGQLLHIGDTIAACLATIHPIAGASATPSSGAKPMARMSKSPAPSPPPLEPSGARSREDITITLNTPEPAAPALSHRGAIVRRLGAALDALGIPHDKGNLGIGDDNALARSRLIDGLQRGFSRQVTAGVTRYARQPGAIVSRDPRGEARLLRGAARINAATVRVAAAGLAEALMALPDRSRFQSRRPVGADLRARVRDLLDQLVETASEPLGINVRRGHFLFQRLQHTLGNVLEDAEILDQPTWREACGGLGLDGNAPPADLAAPLSAVADEEARASLMVMLRLLAQIGAVVTRRQRGSERGIAAARLEELLSDAHDSATALDTDLAAAGVSLAERTVLFAAQSQHEPISIAEFLDWARTVTAPFSGGNDEAAELLPDEAEDLAVELSELADCAHNLATSRTGALAAPWATSRLADLHALLVAAAKDARRLSENPVAA